MKAKRKPSLHYQCRHRHWLNGRTGRNQGTTIGRATPSCSSRRLDNSLCLDMATITPRAGGLCGSRRLDNCICFNMPTIRTWSLLTENLNLTEFKKRERSKTPFYDAI